MSLSRSPCGFESEYGVCHRRAGHLGPCATAIGDSPAFWFAWKADGSHLGYGWFRHGRFRPARGNNVLAQHS